MTCVTAQFHGHGPPIVSLSASVSGTAEDFVFPRGLPNLALAPHPVKLCVKRFIKWLSEFSLWCSNLSPLSYSGFKATTLLCLKCFLVIPGLKPRRIQNSIYDFTSLWIRKWKRKNKTKTPGSDWWSSSNASRSGQITHPHVWAVTLEAVTGSDPITDSLISVWLLFCNVSPGIASIPGRINRSADQQSLTVSEDKYSAPVIPSSREKLNTEGNFTFANCKQTQIV